MTETKVGIDDYFAAGATIDNFWADVVDHLPSNFDARFLDLRALMAGETTGEPAPLIPLLLPECASAVLYSPAGAGKSLEALELSANLASGRPIFGELTSPHKVLYLDYENEPSIIRDRLEAQGYGTDDETLFANLHYSSYADWPPLDSEEGGRLVVELAQQLRASLVVIDTISRATKGDENDSGTYQRYYRNVGMPLKRSGIAQLRLDHSGKDASRGQRGSSAKDSDVDLIYRLTASGDEVTIKREKNRINLGSPDEITLRRKEDPLRHELASEARAHVARVAATDQLLDELGVSLEAGRNVARKAIKEAGRKISNGDLAQAIQRRKLRARISDASDGTSSGFRLGRTGASDNLADRFGQVRTASGQVPDSCPRDAAEDLSETAPDSSTPEIGRPSRSSGLCWTCGQPSHHDGPCLAVGALS